MNLPTKPSEILTSELENLQETIFAFQSRGLQHVAEIHKIELTADVASAMLTYLGGNLRRIRDFFAEVEAANNLPDNEKLDAVKSLISMIVWNAFDIKEQLERTPLDTPAADSN